MDCRERLGPAAPLRSSTGTSDATGSDGAFSPVNDLDQGSGGRQWASSMAAGMGFSALRSLAIAVSVARSRARGAWGFGILGHEGDYPMTENEAKLHGICVRCIISDLGFAIVRPCHDPPCLLSMAIPEGSMYKNF